MKDVIQEFEVDVDVSDRTRLYDYATSRHISRKDGEKWEAEHFHPFGGTAHVDAADENLMLQVNVVVGIKTTVIVVY